MPFLTLSTRGLGLGWGAGELFENPSTVNASALEMLLFSFPFFSPYRPTARNYITWRGALSKS